MASALPVASRVIIGAAKVRDSALAGQAVGIAAKQVAAAVRELAPIVRTIKDMSKFRTPIPSKKLNHSKQQKPNISQPNNTNPVAASASDARGMGMEVSVPSGRGYVMPSLGHRVVANNATATRIVGSTILGVVTVPATFQSSRPALAFVASSNPSTFGDRLAYVALSYDKYVYHKATIRFVPAVSTSQSGTVILAADRDYASDPTLINLQQATSYERSVWGPVWAPLQTTYVRSPEEKRTYFMSWLENVDIRETEQFKFYAFTALGVTAGQQLGTYVLDYDLEFTSPIFAAPTNIQQLSRGFTYAQATTCSWAASTTTVTLPVLPASPAAGCVFEVFISSTVLAPASLYIGFSSGPQWAPSAAVYRLFFYSTNSGYVASPTYGVATASASNALYNITAGALTPFGAAVDVYWRPLMAYPASAS